METAQIIDNSALLPPVLPDDQVTMIDWHPDWVKDIVMVQFRVETVSPKGTFEAAIPVLDHYAEVGVNCIWLNPIFQREESGYYTGNNGYGSYGPHVIDKRIAGTDGPDEERYAAVRRFVQEAHKRNIRVLSDIVVWGVCKGSPLGTEHPEIFMYENGLHTVWGGWAYNWNTPAFKEWYVSATVEMLCKTELDGLRVDLEPTITGYHVFKEIRDRMYARGRKICIFSEGTNSRQETYDFEEGSIGADTDTPLDQWGNAMVETLGYYMNPQNNIVDSIQTGRGVGILSEQREGNGGKARFYVNNLCCHDHYRPGVCGDRVNAGYQAIFAPFIPMWWIGEEWNNTMTKGGTNVMYFTDIHWDELNDPEKRAFFEDFKAMMRIRRQYPEIFTYSPANHRETNICKVQANTPLQAYARYAEGKTVLILPNSTDETLTVTALRPDVATGDTVCELFQGQDLQTDGQTLKVTVPPHTMSIILIQ